MATLYSSYIYFYWGYIYNSSHESVSLKHFFQSLRWLTICERNLIASRSLFKVQYRIFTFSCQSTWISPLQNYDKMNMISLHGRFAVVVSKQKCGELFWSVLRCCFEVAPLHAKNDLYFPEIRLRPGGATARGVTMRDCAVLTGGIRDRDGRDFNTLTQEPFPCLRHI